MASDLNQDCRLVAKFTAPGSAPVLAAVAALVLVAVSCTERPVGAPRPIKRDTTADTISQAEVGDLGPFDVADGGVADADWLAGAEATGPEVTAVDEQGSDLDATVVSDAQDADAVSDALLPAGDAALCATNTDCPPTSPCDNASCIGGLCSHAANASVCNDGDACTIDSCNLAAGCLHTPSADPLCGVVPLPYATTLACNDADLGLWQRSGADLAAGAVRWNFDATPWLPGAFSPACSLNVNNGKDLTCGPGQTALKATADSPWFNAEKIPGKPIGAYFKTAGSLDKGQTASVLARTTTSDWTLVGTVAPTMAWQDKMFASSAWPGHKFQLRFQLDGPCGTSTEAGWFVDNISVQVHPCALGGGCPSDTECNVATTGSVICEMCKTGFHLAPAAFGPACVGDDECATPGICGPHASCMFNPGTNICMCNFGYAQTPAKTCIWVDGCAGGFKCNFYQACVSTTSGSSCKPCPDGYGGPGCTYVMGSKEYPAAQCSQLQYVFPSIADGIYWLVYKDLPLAQYYCDMKNGGWTLVFSNDFEDKKLSGWSQGGISTCASLGSILGGFDLLGPGVATSKIGAAPGHAQYKLIADVIYFGPWNGEKVVLSANGKEIWSQAMVASAGVSASGCGSASFADSKVSMAVTVDDLQYAGPIEVEATSTLASGSKASFGLDNVKLWSR